MPRINYFKNYGLLAKGDIQNEMPALSSFGYFACSFWAVKNIGVENIGLVIGASMAIFGYI